jgi:hypothetical protein
MDSVLEGCQIMITRNLYKILLFFAVILCICALFGDMAVAASNNATASADFLNIGVGARAAGLGGAYTSIADDATASYWNPGGLVSIESPQLIFSHFAWYQDINYEYLAVVLPVGDRFAFSIHSSYLDYGTIEGYDVYDNPTGSINSTYDLAAGVSVGYKVTDDFSAGLTAKYVMLSLDNVKASAIAADLGAKYKINNYVFGVSLANLGQDFKFNREMEKLPVGIRVGMSATPFGPSLLGAIEVESQFYGGLAIKNGVELNFEKRYFLRTGYSFYPGQDNQIVGQALSFGVGALLGPTQFDYTFSPKENIGAESIHRLSIILRL